MIFLSGRGAMAMCSIPSMACCRTRKFESNLLLPMPSYSLRKMLLTRGFMQQRPTHTIASSGRTLGNGGPPRVVNLGNSPETLGGKIRKPAEVQQLFSSDSLIMVGFMIACPGLVLSMFDPNAVAAEVNPISSATLSNADSFSGFVSVLGDLDPGSSQLATSFAGPLIAVFNVLFIFRIIMSWYPGIPVKKFPFFLAYNPTEPVLGPTRRLIPPVGGVDVAPVIWVAVMSFANEILLGKQGLLVLLSQQQS